ncbi:MAG: isopeptide-forming domain-containing fimbrial protein, partial [Clostridiales Family XIII bacterium]|nr:isopeptide-forming domain-containing fimbrial protein [Clostridiales Family XIII bacterium]
TYGTDPDTACILPDGTYRVVDLLSGDGKYTLKVTNANATTWMFGPTATRAANPGDTIPDTSASPATGFQQNIFVSTDADVTATATVSAGWTDPSGADLEHRVSSEARYNIGVLGKADTTLTWQSADTTKGTVSGAGVTGSPAKKTLTDAPQTTLTAPQPEVTTTAGYTFTGWVRVTAGGIAPAWNATPTAGLTAAQVAASVNSPFGSGSGTYGYIDYDYYAVFEADSAPLGGVAKTVDGTDTVLNSTQEAISYHVLATLPAITSNYETLTLEDQVPAVFEILSVGFTGDATGKGTIGAIANNKVTATITADADFTALAGKVVDLVITVRLKAGTTSADNTTAPIVNTATVTPEYKSGPQDPTPPAITGPGVDIDIPDPPANFSKSIDGTDYTLDSPSEELTYHVTFDIPSDTHLYSSITVTDNVPAALQIVTQAAVGDSAGMGTLTQSGNTITYTISSATELAALQGKTVNLAITVKSATGVTSAAAVKNKVSMDVTYKTDVDDPPADPPDAEAPPIDVDIPTAPSGTVKTIDGTDKVLNSTTELLTYHVMTTLPAVTLDYETLTLEDEVPAAFEIVSAGFAGDAAGMGTVTIVNNKVTATITDDAEFAALTDAKVDLVITVRLAAGTTSANNTNTPIVNKGKVTVDYKTAPDPTPEEPEAPGVEINIPDPPTGFFKQIDGTDTQLNSATETLVYHIRYTLPADTSLYESVLVSDAVPAQLRIYNVSAVGAAAGRGQLTRSGNQVSYTISAGDLTALAGQTVDLAVTVGVADGVSVASNIINAASLDVTYKADVDDPPADPPTTYAPPVSVLQYYLVTFVNGFGAVLKIESVPYAGSATAPGNPAYPSYTFVGWDRSYSYITSNITVTARWSYVYVPPVVVPDPDPTPDPEPTPEPTPTAVTTSTTPTVTTPVTPVTDSANIGDEDTPRSVYLWNNHAWSLVSLILSCIAVVIAIILLVGGLTKRRRDEDYDEVSGAQNATTQQQEEREKQHRRGNLLRLLAIIIGILTPIVWLILDDLTLPMALFNVWTIIVAFVFLVHIIFTLLYNARKDKNRHNGEDYEYAQAR